MTDPECVGRMAFCCLDARFLPEWLMIDLVPYCIHSFCPHCFIIPPSLSFRECREAVVSPALPTKIPIQPQHWAFSAPINPHPDIPMDTRHFFISSRSISL